ncbi:hypothetical protein LguiA_015675 [Lonicera macranthoides]
MWKFGRKGESGFSATSTAEEVTLGVDGNGLTAIVTGASSGIGMETARVLALRGVHVIMPVRNVESGKKVKEAIIEEIPEAKIEVMELDLSSMESVKNFASRYCSLDLPLNILVNNAGLFAPPYTLSQDKIELQFATNHLGHVLLTNLLLETMKNTARESHKEGRIVNISSSAHTYVKEIHFDKINDESSYHSSLTYCRSKLCNILHANELARRLKEEGVDITANSVDPGIIPTNIFRHYSFINGIFHMISKLLFKSIPQGAATTCYVALNPQVKGVTGKYFVDNNITEPSPTAKDEDLAKKLWDFSLNLTDPK